MSFFDELEENFEKVKSDQDRIRREQKKFELNKAIKEALEILNTEAKTGQIEFSFISQPCDQIDTWTTYYKGKMIVLFTQDISNELSISPELDVMGAVKKVLIDKVPLAR
ncbi:hypothetical protein D3C74_227630 [compost metagenome]